MKYLHEDLIEKDFKAIDDHLYNNRLDYALEYYRKAVEWFNLVPGRFDPKGKHAKKLAKYKEIVEAEHNFYRNVEASKYDKYSLATSFYYCDAKWFFEMLKKYPREFAEDKTDLKCEELDQLRDAIQVLDNFKNNENMKISSLPDILFTYPTLYDEVVETLTERIYEHFKQKLASAGADGQTIKAAIDTKIKEAVNEMETKKQKYLSTKLNSTLEEIENYEV